MAGFAARTFGGTQVINRFELLKNRLRAVFCCLASKGKVRGSGWQVQAQLIPAGPLFDEFDVSVAIERSTQALGFPDDLP